MSCLQFDQGVLDSKSMGQSAKPTSVTEALVREHWRSVFSVCVAHTRTVQDAEDAMQDTFTKAIQHFDSLRDAAKTRPWLFGIARRVCADKGRKKHRVQPLTDQVYVAPCAEDPRVGKLQVTLSRLSASYREVLTLHYLDGYSTIDLAKNLGLKAATVRKRLARARLKVHQLMTEDQS